MNTLPLTDAAQDMILREGTSVRRGIVRVQATAKSEPLLKLAGFKEPLRFGNYDVPVRENDFGQLVVIPAAVVAADNAAGKQLEEREAKGAIVNLDYVKTVAVEELAAGPSGLSRFNVEIKVPTVQFEKSYEVIAASRWEALTTAVSRAQAEGVRMDVPATYCTTLLGPVKSSERSEESPIIRPDDIPWDGSHAEALPTRRWRVEVRADETWLSTLIVDAADEVLAGDAAVNLAIARSPDVGFDVWSVALEEDLAPELEGPGARPESGSGEGSVPGGTGALPDPGLARYSSPAFAVGGLHHSARRSGKSLFAQFSDALLDDLSQGLFGVPYLRYQRLRDEFARHYSAAVASTPAPVPPPADSHRCEFPPLVLLAACRDWEIRHQGRDSAKGKFVLYDEGVLSCEAEIPLTAFLAAGGDLESLRRCRLDVTITPLAENEEMKFKPRSVPAPLTAHLSPRIVDPRTLVEIAKSGSVLSPLAIDRLADLAGAKREARRFRIPLTPGECDADVEITGFYNDALPSPLEPSNYQPIRLNDPSVSAAVAALHRCHSLADFEVKAPA